jgi:hypothetical protein
MKTRFQIQCLLIAISLCLSACTKKDVIINSAPDDRQTDQEVFAILASKNYSPAQDSIIVAWHDKSGVEISNLPTDYSEYASSIILNFDSKEQQVYQDSVLASMLYSVYWKGGMGFTFAGIKPDYVKIAFSIVNTGPIQF